MSTPFQREYRGWNITIHCMERVMTPESITPTFTASAHATLLQPSKNGDIWVDARPQVVTLGERVFSTGGQCLEVLLAEVKELIDALKK